MKGGHHFQNFFLGTDDLKTDISTKTLTHYRTVPALHMLQNKINGTILLKWRVNIPFPGSRKQLSQVCTFRQSHLVGKMTTDNIAKF